MIAVERVYLDTNVFIMLSEKNHRLQQLLVKPHQASDDTLINGYESLLQNSEWLDVRPVDRAVLYYAAVLRAQYRHLKLPDAIHVSSAIGQDCSHFLSDDHGIKDRYDVTHRRHGFTRVAPTLKVLRPDEPTLTSLIESLSA